MTKMINTLQKRLLRSWEEVYINLKSSTRKISHARNTNETKIEIELNLDGSGLLSNFNWSWIL